MTALVILRAGPATSVQDAGRHGFQRFGVTPAGPMDWIAHATANLMADNPPGAAAVEIGPAGLAVTAEGGTLRLGLSAAGFRVTRDGSALPTRAALLLEPGAVLEVAPGAFGQWAYLAPAGGFAEPPVLGSHAMHLRSGLGPFGGRAPEAGQRLALARAALPGEGERCLIAAAPDPSGPVRFVPGPQDDLFVSGTVAGFAAADWAVAPRSDRMAWRLAGPRLAHARGHDIVSDGIAMGAIQVPGDGLPLVLMADRQSTGGYPKLGCVIRADLPRLAQLRPGAAVRFAPVTVAQAVAALAAAQPTAARLAPRLRAMRRLREPGR